MTEDMKVFTIEKTMCNCNAMRILRVIDFAGMTAADGKESVEITRDFQVCASI